MKNFLTICLFLSLNFIYAQKIEVSGIAKTSKPRGSVMIVLNDTLKKLPKNFPDSLYEEMWKNKDIINFADENGHFSFKANLKDSLVFSDLDSFSKTVKISEIHSKKNSFNIILEPLPCIEYVPCNESNPESYIFIGNKIEVNSASDPRYCNMVSMDHKYQSKYKILEKLSPNINFETIDFVSYDHASKVKYSEYQNVLLFVGKYCGQLIHQKYQYHPAYRTKDGKWATPVVEEYDTTRRKKSNTAPRKVQMTEPIIIPAWQSHRKIEEVYPKPYFKIKKGKVYMLYGYYPEDLINK